METQEHQSPRRGAIPPAEPALLAGLVDYATGSVVSRSLVQSKPASVTLFAFDAGQGLNEHTTPYDAHVIIVEGVASLTIGGKSTIARAGEIVRMPANVPHAVEANEPFKMLLLMIRE
ncbi:MAG: cupin domain-containing protein [Candidatus Eisenbacteria bacterium]